MAWAKVAYAHAGNGGSNTATISAINTTGANLLVAYLSFRRGATPVSGDLTDNKSNTWTKVTNTGDAGGDEWLTMWYSTPSSVGSGHTVSVSCASLEPGLQVIAFSGAASSSVLDQDSGSHTSFGTTVQPGSLTADTYLGVTGVAFGFPFGAFSGISADSGFTTETYENFNDHVTMGANLAWKVFGAGAENPTLTSTTTQGLQARMWTFKIASGVTPKLKRNSSLSGLGASGPFFHDPLSSKWHDARALWACDQQRRRAA